MGTRATTQGLAKGGDGERSGLDSCSDPHSKNCSSEAYSREDRELTLDDCELGVLSRWHNYGQVQGLTRLRFGERGMGECMGMERARCS